MLCVHNDIVRAVDQKRIVALVLLDLSAAFDTVDRATLLSVLQTRFGVDRAALTWFKSHLSDRFQASQVSGAMPEPVAVDCSDVPHARLRALCSDLSNLSLNNEDHARLSVHEARTTELRPVHTGNFVAIFGNKLLPETETLLPKTATNCCRFGFRQQFVASVDRPLDITCTPMTSRAIR